MPLIRPLTSDDVEDALTLSTTAGWNQRPEDWRMLLRLAAGGSFGAVDGQRMVGSAIGIDYGGFGWIAMMLVDPAYRGRGLGARLLEAALGAIPSGKPVRLDATPLGRPLYERYGFEPESELTRYVREARENQSVSARDAIDGPPRVRSIGPSRDGGSEVRGFEEARVRELSASDLTRIAERDAEIFAGLRRPVLEWALADAPGYAQVACDSGGPAEYCFGRHGRLFDQIGPVVARTAPAAALLAGTALRAAGDRTIAIDAFDVHTEFTDWLRAGGFLPQRPLFRMCRRASQRQERSAGDALEFAIFGPEFG